MIRKRFDLVAGLLMVLISALISGCSFTNILNDPTPTPTHTITVTPTATLTPTPSSTPSPQPTSTVTPVPIPTNISIGETGLSLGFLKPVENAGFAVRQVIGYGADDQVEKGVAMISSDGLIFVGFEAFDFDPSYDSIEEMNAAFLEGFSSELDFSFESSEPYPIIIDGQQALAYDLSSDTYRLKGQSFVLNTDNGLFVYGFGFGLSPTYSSTWDKEGRAVFTALLDTFELIPVTSGKCNISADPTYGYTTDNPVKISGSSTNKYIRETRYLAHLRQPYGESVTYQRLGSVEVMGNFLDEFEVTLGDQTVRLYFDYNSSGDLLAPLGMDCWGEISVQDYAW